ncbi:MAG: hypothetical protein ACJ76H_11190 [Bacteriovoracaceae bacterium]
MKKFILILLPSVAFAANPVQRVWRNFVVDEKPLMCTLENQPLVYSPTSLRMCPMDNQIQQQRQEQQANGESPYYEKERDLL